MGPLPFSFWLGVLVRRYRAVGGGKRGSFYCFCCGQLHPSTEGCILLLKAASLYWRLHPSTEGCIPLLKAASLYQRLHPSIEGCIPLLKAASLYQRLHPSIEGCFPLLKASSLYQKLQFLSIQRLFPSTLQALGCSGLLPVIGPLVFLKSSPSLLNSSLLKSSPSSHSEWLPVLCQDVETK